MKYIIPILTGVTVLGSVAVVNLPTNEISADGHVIQNESFGYDIEYKIEVPSNQITITLPDEANLDPINFYTKEWPREFYYPEINGRELTYKVPKGTYYFNYTSPTQSFLTSTSIQ